MEGDGGLNCDLFLCEQDIHNLTRKLTKETYQKYENDVKYVRMWVQKNKANVFFLQECGIQVNDGLFGKNVPFIIGIQTPWYKEQMFKHGHQKGVSMMLHLAQIKIRYFIIP